MPLPAAKVLGGARARAKAFRPSSLVTSSGMSFGALSGAAITALNKGAALTGALHTTGEGGVSPYHLNGGDLVWQIGTGYFGCRNDDGSFSLPRLVDRVAATPSIRAIEIKLSQGAKPGLGGMLPGAKVTPEIAAIRGVPVGVDCKSPAGHSAFRDVDGLLDLVETIAAETGLPVGIKSAVGEGRSGPNWPARMAGTGRGVDFVTVDGGEGGTGAAPLVFSDHVALPFKWAFPRVYRAFAEQGLHHEVVFIGSGKLGIPENALLALAMGCDMINVGRTAMFAIGCIQAQRCHTGRCPTGVATQSRVAAAWPRPRPEVGALRQLSGHPALRTAVRWPAPAAGSIPPWCRSTPSSCSTSTCRPCESTSCSATSPAGACPARPTSRRSAR